MKNVITVGAALMLTTTIANAGGIERATPSVGLLYEDGDYLELSFGHVAPSVSGVQAITLAPTSPEGAESGDVAGDYFQLGAAYKTDLTDRIGLAVIVDQPVGADVEYAGATGYAIGGATGANASVDSVAFTALVNYKLENNFNVYGGIRAQRSSGTVTLSAPIAYQMDTSVETDFGYVVGAGWEKPEIAARVSLTYQSEITHDFDATENGASTNFSTTMPRSLTLEGQTGVAADTLLFGSIRWVEWTKFDISPTNYGLATSGSSLVDYDDDTVSYNIGLGRRFNDEWSGAVTAGYEASTGGFSGNLGPTDGNKSLGLGVTRTFDNLRVTAGARYIWIGDAETEASVEGVTLGNFEDNTGWAAGLKIAYNF
jgi:long-subunit fatty acid transport protein